MATDSPFTLGIIAGYLIVAYAFTALDFLGISRLNITESRTLLVVGLAVLVFHHMTRAQSKDTSRKRGE